MTRDVHRIGKSTWQGTGYMNGKIGYFRVYQGSALSSSDVTILYNNRTASINYSTINSYYPIYVTKLYNQSTIKTTPLIQTNTSNQPLLDLSTLEITFDGSTQFMSAETSTEILDSGDDSYSYAVTAKHLSEGNDAELMGFKGTDNRRSAIYFYGSGQGNNHTPVNYSVTAGKTDDSFFDTPTNNIATLSPLDRTYTTGVIVSEANTRWQYNYKPASKTVRATMALPATGKIYMEWENEQPSSQGGRMSWGLVRYTSQGNNYDYQAYNHVDYINISFGGSIWNGTTHLSGSWPSFSFYTGERAALAVDCSNGKWWVGKVASNGSTQWYANDGGTDGDPAGGTNESATLPSFTTATEWIPFVGWHDGGAASSTTYYANINFGNHSFLGTVPTGFEKLCSNAFPTPTIKLPENHFNTLVFTGNQSTNARTGLNFQPDWIVYKALNPETGNGETFFHDSVRGPTKRYGVRPVSSDTPTGEVTNSSYLVSFDSNGFTVGNDGVYNTYHQYNQTGRTYQALCWNGGDTDGKTYAVTVVSDSGNKYRFDGFGTSAVTLDLAEGGTYVFDWSDSSAQSHPIRFSTTSDGTHGGGSEYTTGVTKDDSAYKTTITVAASAPQLYYYCQYHSGMGGSVNTNSTLGSSNFDGSTQSIVKVNATAGFSMVAYTGTGSTTTVGHGLGVKPDFMIFRNRNSEGHGWNVYHSVLGATKNLQLNTNAPEATASNKFNNTEPTSSVFTVSTAADTNQSSQTFISYIFTEVEGFSKFGFYDANSSNDGPFAYCGFQPAFILIKRKTSGDNNPWIGYNNVQNPQNQCNNQMVWNTTDWQNIDANDANLDMVSNGFKLRNSAGDFNNSGSSGQYIFIAFAHAPFQFSRAR